MFAAEFFLWYMDGLYSVYTGYTEYIQVPYAYTSSGLRSG